MKLATTGKLFRPLSLICCSLALVSVASNANAQSSSRTTPSATSDIMRHVEFRNIGPTVGGRVTAVVGVPGNPQIYYVGAASGGVFKTTDGGNTWRAIFTHEGTSSIGAIAVNPKEPNHVWVGTGEANVRNDVVEGDGIYYSSNGGDSWKHMGLDNVGQIARIFVDPLNRNIVYVAALGDPWLPNASRGVFKTEDHGRTWKKVLYVSDGTGAIDLVAQPGHPNHLLAAMWQFRRLPWLMEAGGVKSGIYRSTNGGSSWTLLHQGLPTGQLGRIGLAVAPSAPNRVYALIPSSDGILWRSDDFGSSWHLVSKNYAVDFRSFYYGTLAVAPNDPNKIFFNSFALLESDDGGVTTHWADRGAHDDHHDLWIDPKNPERMMQGNDGGVDVTYDGGATWRRLKNLPLAQFYQVGIDRKVPFNMCGGLQDLGVWYGPSNNLGGSAITVKNWFTVNGGDGGYCVPAPSNPQIVYSEETSGGNVTRYDLSTHISVPINPYPFGSGDMPNAKLKYRFNWQTPIAVSSTDANHVYLGGNVVFETYDGGYLWKVISPDLTRNDKAKQTVPIGLTQFEQGGAEAYDTILSISIDKSSESELWVGTDDGLVQLTRDDGKTWANVTPPNAPKWARVYQIGTSAFDPGTAFVPFDAHRSGDFRPYVYMTTDYGKDWKTISKGLPSDGSVNVVRQDPVNKHLLFLGTDNGLYYSLTEGASWQRFTAFPTVPVRDIKIDKDQHDLVIATHGRGLFVLDNIRPLEQFNSQIAAESFHLFDPGTAIEFRHWISDARWETDYTQYRADNPEEGVYIYSFVKGLSNLSPYTIKLTVTRSNGNVITEFTRPVHAGVNRNVWNLRYADSTSLDFISPPPPGPGPPGHDIDPNQGPLVPPGNYEVRAQSGGVSQTMPLHVVKDPNAPYDDSVYVEYATEGLLARNTVSELSTLLNTLHALKVRSAHVLDDLKSQGNQRIQLVGALEAVSASIDNLIAQTYGLRQPQNEIGEISLYRQVTALARRLASTYPYKLPNSTVSAIQNYKVAVDGYVHRYNSDLLNSVNAYNAIAQKEHALDAVITSHVIKTQ